MKDKRIAALVVCLGHMSDNNDMIAKNKRWSGTMAATPLPGRGSFNHLETLRSRHCWIVGLKPDARIKSACIWPTQATG